MNQYGVPARQIPALRDENPDADDYVQDIFGNQYTVIDNIERLPEKLPQLFMALTK